MKTYEVLEKALALIEREENWAQGDYKVGDALCAEGACLVAGGMKLEFDGQRYTFFDEPTPGYHAALDSLQDLLSDSVHLYNDAATHAQVVALFQKAIRAEKQKAGIAIDLPAEVPA